MNRRIAAGVIGTGPHAQALIDHQAPLGRVDLAAFATGPGEAGIAAGDWRSLVADPALPAILAFSAIDARAELVAAALAAGKIVLCPPDTARNDTDLAALRTAQAEGGGILLGGGELIHTEAGRHGLIALRDPKFGALRSLYIAIRQPRGGRGDVIDDLAPEAIDFVLAAIADDFIQVRVNAGRLFGPDRDSAVILLRSAGDVVVTIELARCLPPSLPAPGLGEVEIDAMGARQALRITPLAGAVRIHRDAGTMLVPWLNAPVVNMLGAVEAAFDGRAAASDGLECAGRALRLMTAIRAAA